MRIYLQTTLFFVMLSAWIPLCASTATDFYLDLLQRGTAEADAGRYNTSITPLRLAAFGLVDSIEHYETAQAYLAVALDKLGQQEEARRAAQRIVAAEGIERKFATLPLPPSIRTAFGAVARKLLSSVDAAALTAPPQTSTAPKRNTSPVVPPQTTSPAAVPQTQMPPRTAQRNDPPKVAENPKPAPQTQTPPRNDPPKVAAPAPAQNSSSTQKPTVTETPKRNDPPKIAEAPKPTPPATTTAPVTPPKPTPLAPKPQTAQPALQPQIQPAQPQPARIDVASRLAAGERALATANLTEARRIYRELLTVPSLDRNTIIRIGEGLYRSRDFGQALTAFRRLGTLKPGEEAYRYYIAVVLFETGDFAAAKRELAAALAFIEITPDVQRYREKIEGARN